METVKNLSPEMKSGNAIELLVVEDSSTQAMLLKQTLEENAFTVIHAKDGMEALELIGKKRPDLIISDIEMPRLNGFELCRKLKSTPGLSSIPVIILTNLSDSMDVIEGIKSGADSFLTKPCTTEILLSTIMDMLQNSKAKPESQEVHPFELIFRGQPHRFNVSLAQITNLLLSTYSSAIEKNRELEQAYQKLNVVHTEVENANIQLKNLNDQKNFFLGMAAHDLRSPLVAIQGYSELLLDRDQILHDPEMKKMVSRIHSSSEFMLRLVNELLDLSAIESGKVKLHLSDTDLRELLEECIALNSGQASKKEISIKYEGVPSVPKIRCDQEKLEQVINNLITNAIKYSKEKTEIQVSLSHTASDVIIAVKDQGVGIAPQDIGKLFTPFTKTDSKTTHGEKSTGLGLAISKRIVLEQEGDIWVESEAGKGSSFYVKLPFQGKKAHS